MHLYEVHTFLLSDCVSMYDKVMCDAPPRLATPRPVQLSVN
jgi:hypothetical protein